MAASMSAAVPSAATPRTSSVAGLIVSNGAAAGRGDQLAVDQVAVETLDRMLGHQDGTSQRPTGVSASG